MRITAIEGQLITLGESELKNGVKTYDYLSFADRHGGQTVVKKVRVAQDVDRLLGPGADGVFIVGKTPFETGVYAVRVGNLEAASEWVNGNLTKAYIGLAVLFILGLVLTATVIGAIIGIPFLILGLWVLLGLPSWRKNIAAAAHQHGMTLQAARTI